MSQQKQRIAKKLLALGIETFTGEKVNGKYIVGMVSFKSLKEIEAYIKELEKANAQQSVAEAGVVETVKPAERTPDMAIELEVGRQLSLLRSATIGGLRWIARCRGVTVKSRTRAPLIDAIITAVREDLYNKAA
jgi:hypothetical protein